MGRISLKYDLTKYNRPTAPMSIQSFTIRETNGTDEENASNMAKAKGENVSVYAELVRMSITEVDGKAVNSGDGVPLKAYDDWNSRTRTFIVNAFKALNGIDEKGELADFLASGTPAL